MLNRNLVIGQLRVANNGNDLLAILDLIAQEYQQEQQGDAVTPDGQPVVF